MRRLLLIMFATTLVACNFSEEYNYEIPSPEESSATPPVVLFGESDECLTTSEEFGLWLCPAIEGQWDSIAWWVDERYTSSERTIHIAPTLGIHTVRAKAFVSKNGATANGTAEVRVRVVESEQLPLRLHLPQSSYSVKVGKSVRIEPIVFEPAPPTVFMWSVKEDIIKSSDERWFDFCPQNAGTHIVRLSANGQLHEIIVKSIASDSIMPRPATAQSSAVATTVLEYSPAAGQFINTGVNGRTPEEYATAKLQSGQILSLGGFGGRLIVKFDHSIMCSGGYDLRIRGNAFNNSSEPGIVWVMQDTDGNGLPDDTWYELRGSEHDSDSTRHNTAITYLRNADHPLADVQWRASDGRCGVVERNSYHTNNSYFPQWESNNLTLWGTLLPSRVERLGGKYIALPYGGGYADNYGNDLDEVWNRFRISDAVNANGEPADLSHIDFVMVQSAVRYCSPEIGEISTEVSAIEQITTE